MGKKLIWLLGIAMVLLFGGWLLYHQLARVASPSTRVATHWPSSENPQPPPRSSQPSHPAARLESSEKESVPAAPVFSLRQGESLDYDANIAKLDSTVARLQISAVERRGSAGHGTWHLQAFAHTENPYRMVFELDDQFDSYSDTSGMTSVQYEMHLSERGQKVDSVQRMLTSPSDPLPALPAGESGARVLPGTRDPLGMLDYLRSVDWSHTAQVRSPVFDGHKLYEVQAKYVGKANGIHVPAGSYNTNKVEIRVFDNGQEMKDAHFVLYLTNDATRLPVLMEAVLPVATARVELTKVK